MIQLPTLTVPSKYLSSPDMALNIDDLPCPFLPINETNSPLCILNEISLKTPFLLPFGGLNLRLEISISYPFTLLFISNYFFQFTDGNNKNENPSFI